ncbi:MULTISPECIES: hypothetical protein [Hyphomonas]|jgi:hypothetical protein|uniref:hypothetical protein n=1 Tax=Hyphomonas TaxID=85 RepID=UPI003511C05F
MSKYSELITSIGPYAWELTLAILFTLIGAVFSRHEIGKRERRAVVKEIIMIQRRLFNFATRNWTQEGGNREVWMIELLVERVGTLRTMVTSKDKLPEKLDQYFTSYEVALQEFGAIFTSAARRGERFWKAYERTTFTARQLSRTLSKHYTAEQLEVFDQFDGARDSLRQSSDTSFLT